ncbi:MAG: TOBE domain-containing protein [Proteobacteria bacterium]|nr:TOBE domain-containing protein [Pseudomonadota bacterium]
MAKEKKRNALQIYPAPALPKKINQGTMVLTPEDDVCLDSVQLGDLEQSFRTWARDSNRKDVQNARKRILMVFLLIRYTGAKLNEVLGLKPFADINFSKHELVFPTPPISSGSRIVPIPEDVSREIEAALSKPDFRDSLKQGFNVDPAFVRRKFYERALDCGFSKHLGGPEMIRKARAVELLKGNMPLPAVQSLLGHARPNQTSSYVSFSKDEINQATRLFMERESSRKTSARNAFFCKISHILMGDIQTRVDMVTMEGHHVTTVITTDSLKALGLAKGSLITAEVKAPWIDLYKGKTEPLSSAENRFQGVITDIKKGTVNSEYVIQVSSKTALCSIVSSDVENRLSLRTGDRVWALFNCFAVVLHRD